MAETRQTLWTTPRLWKTRRSGRPCITPHNTPGAHTVAAGLRTHASGGRVMTKEQWRHATSPGTDRTNHLGLLPALGTALPRTVVPVALTVVAVGAAVALLGLLVTALDDGG